MLEYVHLPNLPPPYDARGSEYGLYLLEANEKALFEYNRAQGHANWRAGWGLRGRLWDSNQIERSFSGEVPANALIDDASGKMVVPGLEYVNYSPQKLAEIKYDVVLLSYNRAAWRVSERLPFYTTWNNFERDSGWMGRFTPWVRPEHIIGLPTDELDKISDYGTKWGVCLGRLTIGARGGPHD